ncbi:hypothetical protein Brsp03_02411 [Brucella sp. NBRC 12951]
MTGNKKRCPCILAPVCVGFKCNRQRSAELFDLEGFRYEFPLWSLRLKHYVMKAELPLARSFHHQLFSSMTELIALVK